MSGALERKSSTYIRRQCWTLLYCGGASCSTNEEPGKIVGLVGQRSLAPVRKRKCWGDHLDVLVPAISAIVANSPIGRICCAWNYLCVSNLYPGNVGRCRLFSAIIFI